jgi:predicted alpha/beta-fold hydrolase
LGNPHVQTFLGNLPPLRRFRSPTEIRQVLLTDGDRVVVHDTAPDYWQAGDRVGVLVHGLGGSYRSGYMQRVGRGLFHRGFRVIRMDLRGAGQGVGLARRPYHGACSGDVRSVLEQIAIWYPQSPVTLIGFSLGGNIVLKLSGEAAERPVDNLQAVAALAPPVDFERCAALLAHPKNDFYEQFFIRALLRQARDRHRFFPNDPLPSFPKRLKLRLFDDMYTAPRSGFKDAGHYYHTASSYPLLSKISVPTFIITARDDPFIAVEPFEKVSAGPHVQIWTTNKGGHLGFLGNGSRGLRWSEHRIVEWVASLHRANEPET